MAGETPLIPSQVREAGHWRPVRHMTGQSLRSLPPVSTPPRRPSFKAVLRRKPLSTINEDKTPSLRSSSSLRLDVDLTNQFSIRSYSSESLVCFFPSQQLQNYQSVSLHCYNTRPDPTPQMYRTQSQWTAPSLRSRDSSEILSCQSPTVCRTDGSFDIKYEQQLESGAGPAPTGEDIPREAIADLFHRVEEYEQGQPEVVRDSGKVWVRVNSVGHGLSRRLQNMGSLRKRHTFEARLGHNVPVCSQLRIYEKPSHIKRVKIAVHDYWRKFRNWSTGRDTELWATSNLAQHPYHVVNASVVSLDLSNLGPTSHQIGLSTGAVTSERKVHGNGSMRKARRDGKMSTGEQIKRRKSSLFLDVFSSDVSNSSGSFHC